MSFRPSFCLAFDVVAAIVLSFLSSGAAICPISFESHRLLIIR